ncbi:MAG TPA: ASKHA domain-containing protein [Candidatus Lokiarchaeia archaeon]|nr:ASKHA domain-containing protein [Candidatus Lokiarchaeia archaeon]
MPTIIFEPISKRLEVEQGISIYDAAKQLGNIITSHCGGKQTCGKCKIQIAEWTSPLPVPSPAEMNFLSSIELDEGFRLACCTPVTGDIRVFIPEESTVKTGRILEDGKSAVVPLDPAVEKLAIVVSDPHLEEIKSDLWRLLDQLPPGMQFSLGQLQALPGIIRSAGNQVTVTLCGNRILNLQPGDLTSELYGIAVDIGTTTVVGYLVNLRSGDTVAIHSLLNPQTAHGEDVVTRLEFASKAGGSHALQAAIRDGINSIIRHSCEKAGVSPENVAEMTVVGNTAMHHLFLGLDSRFLPMAPFPPVVQQSLDLPASTLELTLPPDSNVHLLPCIAGYVGADTMGDILAGELDNQEKFSLTIDIGTNGELVLGDVNLLATGSCAAGSALEGAHISYGMRAAGGAIERFTIDPATFAIDYTTIDGEPPIGICGSGIIDIVAELLRARIITQSGRFNFKNAAAIDSGLLRQQDGDWAFQIAPAAYTGINRDIILTQEDVRQVQLAKAAFYAGAILLLNNMGRTPADIEQVFLAGAFGSYIDKHNAHFIGMIPDVDINTVYQIGNAAGAGARLALINKHMREKADTIARQVKYVELTTQATFATEYAKAMYFPHLNLAQRFPSLVDTCGGIPKRPTAC